MTWDFYGIKKSEGVDAMDFAESVLARIESLLDKRRKNLTKDQRMELRYYLKDLYLKAE